MTELLACLSTGKGTWQHVVKLIEDEDWEEIFLIGPPFAIDKFTHKKHFEKIIVDDTKTMGEMAEQIRGQLKGKIKNFEVALNLVSGSGREHMAILSALLQLGFAVRLVAVTPDGIKEI